MDLLSSDVDNILKDILDQQYEHVRKGQYTEAEKCRLQFEKKKVNLNRQTLASMNARHKQERDDLTKAKNDQLERFNQLYCEEMDKFEQNSSKLENDLKTKHTNDFQETKSELNRTLPVKVKESSELLNLRKMEEHMAKQKNYNEAHKIQDKANKMFEGQTQTWNQNRNNKIQTTLNTLKAKQKTELTNFQKRVNTSKTEKRKEKEYQDVKINLKYENLMKDLKVVQQREVLGFKGEFKSLGGTASSSPSKSRGTFIKQ